MKFGQNKSHPDQNRYGLIAFWIVVGLAFLASSIAGPITSGSGPGNLAGIVFFSPLVFLCCLLGSYAGLGQSFWRWPVAVLFTPLLGCYSDFLTGGHSLLEFEVFVFGIVGVVGMTTLVLRICKGNLIRVEPGDETEVDALQFGIKHLLIWTTVAAVFVAIGQSIWSAVSHDGSFDRVEMLFFIFGFAASLAIATVIDIWAMFGKQVTATKTAVVLFITIASAMVGFFLMSFNPLFFVVVAVMNQVLVILMMLVLRRQRFRFVKRNSSSS